MSLSYADCFSDLLCSEESGDVISAGNSPEFSSEGESPAIVEEDESIIAGFIEEERNSFTSSAASAGDGDSGSLSLSSTAAATSTSSLLDSSSRSRSVAWILKVRAFYGFQAVTAYLAVNYLDRFLSCHHLPQTGGWPLQLLSVACLSLAAKMEEPLVPSLLDLQVESTKFVFEPKTIQRMELLVLTVLNWRLRLVTPFTFISFFAYKIDASGTYTGLLIARSTDFILSNIHAEASFVEYWPSSIAAAAILCAASEMPSLSFVTPEHAESWCDGLCKENINDCYKLMQQFVVDNSRRKSIKVIPQFRVTAQITKIRSFNDSSPSSSSTSSPSPFSNKRRRLNNNNQSWMDDDHDL